MNGKALYRVDTVAEKNPLYVTRLKKDNDNNDESPNKKE